MAAERSVEVFFSPAEFETLRKRNLSETTCVVFDVLRATSSMVTALANGAQAIIPVSEISEALEIKRKDPDVLLAGEREGLRIEASLSGSVPFDLGNSPREFTSDKVAGKRIVMTTTNGTRALRSCAHAKAVLVSSFLNLKATVELLEKEKPAQLLVICSGTFEEAAYEDILGAGALCEPVMQNGKGNLRVADSVLMSVQLFRDECGDLFGAMAKSRNARRLLFLPELQGDIAFCVQRDIYVFAVGMDKNGVVRRIPS
jgi:2-phosphosulfolactate phosphatase